MSGIPVTTGPVAWFKMNLRCPVLGPESGLCGAYPVRPTPCSTHFVTSDPAQCDPWSAAGGPYSAVPMDDIHEEFMEKMAAVVDGNGILAYRMPLPRALLFAESVRTVTGLSLEDMTSMLRSELL